MEIQHQDLSYEIYKMLKNMILSNELEPGDKLKQEHIAAMFGVSRMPLHRAFQMLENEMLIESIPRRGYFVTKIDISQLIDAFECREVLEGVAARRAANNITKKEVDELKALFSPFKGDGTDDLLEYQEADHQFHEKLIAISDNKVLNRLDLFSNLLQRTYQKGLIRGAEETLKEHFDIIEALEKRDAEEAERLARLHLAKSAKSLLAKNKNLSK